MGFSIIPVLCFGAAWVILYRDLRNKLDLFDRVLLPLGAVLVLAAGFFKAVWKLQTALGADAVELFDRPSSPASPWGSCS